MPGYRYSLEHIKYLRQCNYNFISYEPAFLIGYDFEVSLWSTLHWRIYRMVREVEIPSILAGQYWRKCARMGDYSILLKIILIRLCNHWTTPKFVSRCWYKLNLRDQQTCIESRHSENKNLGNRTCMHHIIRMWFHRSLSYTGHL